jgi:hypothetical protein
VVVAKLPAGRLNQIPKETPGFVGSVQGVERLTECEGALRGTIAANARSLNHDIM